MGGKIAMPSRLEKIGGERVPDPFRDQGDDMAASAKRPEKLPTESAQARSVPKRRAGSAKAPSPPNAAAPTKARPRTEQTGVISVPRPRPLPRKSAAVPRTDRAPKAASGSKPAGPAPRTKRAPIAADPATTPTGATTAQEMPPALTAAEPIQPRPGDKRAARLAQIRALAARREPPPPAPRQMAPVTRDEDATGENDSEVASATPVTATATNAAEPVNGGETPFLAPAATPQNASVACAVEEGLAGGPRLAVAAASVAPVAHVPPVAVPAIEAEEPVDGGENLVLASPSPRPVESNPDFQPRPVMVVDPERPPTPVLDAAANAPDNLLDAEHAGTDLGAVSEAMPPADGGFPEGALGQALESTTADALPPEPVASVDSPSRPSGEAAPADAAPVSADQLVVAMADVSVPEDVAAFPEGLELISAVPVPAYEREDAPAMPSMAAGPGEIQLEDRDIDAIAPVAAAAPDSAALPDLGVALALSRSGPSPDPTSGPSPSGVAAPSESAGSPSDPLSGSAPSSSDLAAAREPQIADPVGPEVFPTPDPLFGSGEPPLYGSGEPPWPPATDVAPPPAGARATSTPPNGGRETGSDIQQPRVIEWASPARERFTASSAIARRPASPSFADLFMAPRRPPGQASSARTSGKVSATRWLLSKLRRWTGL
jgi:hypothetical protein